jgi:hypothetical protein
MDVVTVIQRYSRNFGNVIKNLRRQKLRNCTTAVTYMPYTQIFDNEITIHNNQTAESRFV